MTGKNHGRKEAGAIKTNEIRERILQETIRLIEQEGGVAERVTLRDISAAAGVGVGLINYHFGSKERLRRVARATCAYLAQNERLSRLSILTDMGNGRQGDNTAQTEAACLPLVREESGADGETA